MPSSVLLVKYYRNFYLIPIMFEANIYNNQLNLKELNYNSFIKLNPKLFKEIKFYKHKERDIEIYHLNIKKSNNFLLNLDKIIEIKINNNKIFITIQLYNHLTGVYKSENLIFSLKRLFHKFYHRDLNKINEISDNKIKEEKLNELKKYYILYQKGLLNVINKIDFINNNLIYFENNKEGFEILNFQEFRKNLFYEFLKENVENFSKYLKSLSNIYINESKDKNTLYYNLYTNNSLNNILLSSVIFHNKFSLFTTHGYNICLSKKLVTNKPLVFDLNIIRYLILKEKEIGNIYYNNNIIIIEMLNEKGKVNNYIYLTNNIEHGNQFIKDRIIPFLSKLNIDFNKIFVDENEPIKDILFNEKVFSIINNNIKLKLFNENDNFNIISLNNLFSNEFINKKLKEYFPEKLTCNFYISKHTDKGIVKYEVKKENIKYLLNIMEIDKESIMNYI